MRFEVLGPVGVVGDDGAPVVLRSAAQRLLLAVLVAARGRTLQVDELAEALWADTLPADPAGALQSHVSRLRRRLGPAATGIETTSTGYRLVCDPTEVDSVRFETLVKQARELADEPSVVAGWLDQALALWSGRAYEDLVDHPFIAAEATRLEELKAEAVELRADCLLSLGRPAEAEAALRQIVASHPFRERPVVMLMRVLAADGRHADALAEFEYFRRLLDDELGLEPSPELRAVEAAVLGHDDTVRSSTSVVGLPGNSFVGRDAEFGKTTSVLDQHRLVTITGPGGVGKTRLALHVAADQADAYPDGVYLCELARVPDPDAVTAAVASSLHVEERAHRSLAERVIEFLQTKRALLVIDNCEHVLPAASEIIAAVLVRTPHVRVLATSRERLGVEGEQVVTLGPLSTPAWDDPNAPSVALFTDRARAVRPDVTVGNSDLATVCELCLRLDGLPLAIELAAAQSVSMSPPEILAAIEDRLSALTDRRRTVARHRSLDAVFGWSYDLLAAAERDVFEQLAVFAGGWTADAAATVAGGTAHDLATLVERSLVTTRRNGRQTRFSMLEPVRQYAEARLRERDREQDARRRHATWTVAFVESADKGMRGPAEADWLERIDDELANLRVAFRWCAEHDADLSIRFAASLYRYIWSGASSEVFVWADEAVAARSAVTHPLLPAAYATAALGWSLAGDLARARELALAGIAEAQDDPATAHLAWQALGDIENFAGGFEEAIPYYDRAVELARAAGNIHDAAVSLCTRAMSFAYAGRSDDALDACNQLAPLVTQLDNPSTAAFFDYTNGEIRLDHAPADALPFLRRSVAAARHVGNRLIAGLAGLSATSCEARVGDPTAALEQYADLIDHWHRSGAWNMQWATLRTLIELLARLGRDTDATALYGAMLASPTAPPVAGADAGRIGEAVATLRARLGSERFEEARADGAVMSDNDAVAFALRCVGGAGQAHAAARAI